MPNNQTVYNDSWKSTYDWICPSQDSKFKARCRLCKKEFAISNGGIQQVKQHSQTKTHIDIEKSLKENSNQMTFYQNNGVVSLRQVSGSKYISKL